MSDFGSTLKFRPHYVFWENDLGKGGFNTKDTRCVSGGRYCDADSEIGKKENVLNGKNLIPICRKQIVRKTCSLGSIETNLFERFG